MLPVSFSGIGVREGGYRVFLAKVGVSKHAALALGLLSSGVVLLTGISGGLVYLFWKAQVPGAGGGQLGPAAGDPDRARVASAAR